MLPPNTFSDLPQYGAGNPRSVTVVLLDNLNTLYGSAPEDSMSEPLLDRGPRCRTPKTHLIEFVKTLDPRDRVAIYGLRDSLHILCDFTNDRDQFLAILKSTTPDPLRVAPAEPGL